MLCEYCGNKSPGEATMVCGHIGAITNEKRLYALCTDHAAYLKGSLSKENLATYKERRMPGGMDADAIAVKLNFQADFADRAMFDPEHDMSTDYQDDFGF